MKITPFLQNTLRWPQKEAMFQFLYRVFSSAQIFTIPSSWFMQNLAFPLKWISTMPVGFWHSKSTFWTPPFVMRRYNTPKVPPIQLEQGWIPCECFCDAQYSGDLCLCNSLSRCAFLSNWCLPFMQRVIAGHEVLDSMETQQSKGRERICDWHRHPVSWRRRRFWRNSIS